MTSLREADLRGALEFIELAWVFAGEQPFPRATLEALGRLIACDDVGYSDLDRVDRRTLEYVGRDDDDRGGDALFWSIVDEHPLCRHQQAYGDFSATRLSDVVSHRKFVGSRVYAEWFRPAGIVAELDAGTVRSRTRTRNFVLSRSTGDFSDRDRAVLNLVVPHLARIRETAELRHKLDIVDPGDLTRLTTRENEIIELVAAGLTNAAIAQRLWISPGTVKKHLDNVYAKLGVGNRTAAVARIAHTS